MDFLIDFFREIDGPLYYSILVVNTILIFAIIGYLGEKSNEQLMKANINTEVNMGGANTLNMNTPKPVNTTNVASIPKVSATPVSRTAPNQTQPLQQSMGQINSNVSTPNVNQTPKAQVQPFNNNQPVTNPQVTSNAVPLQNLNNQPTANAGNQVNPQEKAPAVLVINSNNNSKI